VKLLDAEACVERLDGEQAAAFVPEHQKPVDADAVRRQELRPPAAEERALAVAPDLHAPDLTERAHHERHRRGGEATGELVGKALQPEQGSAGRFSSVEYRRLRSTADVLTGLSIGGDSSLRCSAMACDITARCRQS
jgi:hypothetical protein